MKKRGLYINCENGISGDMSVGALLSLGATETRLVHQIKSLASSEFSIEISQFEKFNTHVWDYDVIINPDFIATNKKRNIFDVYKIIHSSSLTYYEKKLSEKIFTIAAKAGAAAHKVSVKDFYFHEAGATDSIADIIGVAICLNDIILKYNINQIFISELIDGTGPIKLRNNKILPVPVPAVNEILNQYKLPYKNSDIPGEFVTPTGASFIAAIYSNTTNQLPDEFTVLKTGYGNGKRKSQSKSILAIDLIEW